MTIFFLQSRELIREFVELINHLRDHDRFPAIRFDPLYSSMEKLCQVEMHKGVYTAHMGTILMMSISKNFEEMLFYGRRESPYLEELQDSDRYQSGFFAGKCFFSGRWWYLDDLISRMDEIFAIVEIADLWDRELGDFKRVCYLQRISDMDTPVTSDDRILFDLSSQTWDFLLHSDSRSKYRVKTGGMFPYFTLSIILFTDDLAIRKRTTSPAESVSMVLGNLPKY